MAAVTPAWSIEDAADAADLAVLADGVLAHGRAEAAAGNARPLACFLREHGSVVAGASGRTEYGRLFVACLWVAPDRRRRGLGREALSRIEAAARARGARDALIETLSDATARFYARLGYTPLATIERFVGPFTRHVLLKRLEQAPPGAAPE
jgi:GNAT superfamily N-acetyltransferase